MGRNLAQIFFLKLHPHWLFLLIFNKMLNNSININNLSCHAAVLEPLKFATVDPHFYEHGF